MTAGADVPHRDGCEIVRLGVVDSTQAVAFALAERGAADGTVVVADSQRAGRGRESRRWHDEPGASLLCSILVRPRVPPAQWPLLSLVTGVAVAHALRRGAGVAARLKWPNDVVVEGRKLAGILLESRLASPPAVVIGIGINVGQERFPGELSGMATSIRLVTGRSADREALLPVLLEELTAWRDRLEHEGFAPVREAWKALSATLGRDVRGDEVSGRAVDLDLDGALVIDDGRRRHRLVAGELSAAGRSAAGR
jgi:BirA family transcriptional regulator, biotin operon repressor / biotin---[acetyl-CoA-carboxylase] ligase